MKVKCGSEIPVKGYVVSELIRSLELLPQDAQVQTLSYAQDAIQVWWEEER